MNRINTLLLAALLSATAACANDLDRYNIAWDTPSENVSGTMPLGNGDVALNAWVEGGDLLLLLAKNDAWDENCILCKLGRVRVKLTPSPFVAGSPFRQELVLKNGEINITAGAAGAKVGLHIWVDANRPVIRMESKGEQPFTQQVSLETWRDKEYEVAAQVSDFFCGNPAYKTIVFPDVVAADQKNRILVYHHNHKPANDGYEITLKLQGMEHYQQKENHPLLGRTFGAAIKGTGLISVDARTLKSDKPAVNHLVSIYALTTHPATPKEWTAKLDALIHAADDVSLEKAYAKHVAWWEAFWGRSWVRMMQGEKDAVNPKKASPFEIARGYQLTRFMAACAGRGAQPIKFNGSVFSVGTPTDPDSRRWGGPGFWFQNTRHSYWPMMADGDFDLMEPWFRMYREALPFAKERVKRWYKHEGALFGETVMFWGAEASYHYGWTPFEKRSKPECELGYLTYYWQNNLEMIAMMLNYYAYTGDRDFLKNTLLPHADEVTKFYDLHYTKRDAQGKILFSPAQALETWHVAVNPLPEIVGLRSEMPRLLNLPESLTTPEQRARWKRLLDDAPPVPAGERRGKSVFLPADTFSAEANYENPELYGVFPYRLHGLGKPGLDIAINTFETRKYRQSFCWCQNETQAALLGLTEEVRKGLQSRASANAHAGSRFPTFWASSYDAVPDVDHGGNLQQALQFMLLQADGDKINLLPAWPKDWDVSFKLHAPQNTTVEGEVKNGELLNLKVTPNKRKKDVVVMPLKDPPPPPPVSLSLKKPATASSTAPQYFEKDAVDGNEETCWSCGPHQASGWLAVDLGAPTEVGRAVVKERFPMAKKYTIEAQLPDGSWNVLASGGAIGEWVENKFTPVKAQHFRVNILESGVTQDSPATVNIGEFELYAN